VFALVVRVVQSGSGALANERGGGPGGNCSAALSDAVRPGGTVVSVDRNDADPWLSVPVPTSAVAIIRWPSVLRSSSSPINLASAADRTQAEGGGSRV